MRIGRCALGALIVLCDFVAPRAAPGQAVFQITPVVATTEIYDSNLFFTPLDPQADFMTRVSAGIDSQYQSPLLTFGGRYRLDAERFAEHHELTTLDGRQDAAMNVRYRPTRRTTFSTAATFTSTRTPGELNAGTGLALMRAKAQRLTVHPSMTRQVHRTAKATVDYSFTEDQIVGGVRLRAHSASVDVERHASTGDAITVGVAVQRFEFGAAPVTSEAVLVGWTRQISRRTSVALRGGPRVTDGATAAELSASVRAHMKPADLSLDYARTQTTAIGLAGPVETNSLTATASWRLRRSFELRMTPGAFQSMYGGLQSRAYRLALEASQQISRQLSLVASYDANLQNGQIYAVAGSATISRHVVLVSLVRTPVADRH
jgi:hypothetical protein